MRFELADGATQGVIELVQRAIHGELQGLGLVGHGDGLEIGHAGLEHAALVGAAFAGVDVAEVHFHARDAIRELGQGVFDCLGQAFGRLFDQSNMVVVVHLYLHATSFGP